MPRFALSGKAKSDLQEIARYTQRHWGRKQRIKYLAMLDACFRELATNPNSGKDCSEIRLGYRGYPVGSHLVFYRQTGDRIDIIRILHQSMEIGSRLAKT